MSGAFRNRIEAANGLSNCCGQENTVQTAIKESLN